MRYEAELDKDTAHWLRKRLEATNRTSTTYLVGLNHCIQVSCAHVALHGAMLFCILGFS